MPGTDICVLQPQRYCNGPFYLTDEERETTRKDKLMSLNNDKESKKSKAELVDDLMQTEWGWAEEKIVTSKILVRDLQKKATLLGTNTLKIDTRSLVPRWEGKGKILL
jgi:hypothetical protein